MSGALPQSAVWKISSPELQEVAGILASESVDRDDEVFDYDKSKKYFQQWSDNIHNATSKIAGEENASFGNVRLMHGKQTVGKLTKITFDDAKKIIWGIAKISDSKTWEDIKSGIYSAFSIGGKLVSSVIKAGKRWLTVNPMELSIVDYPANGDATFQWAKVAKDANIDILLAGVKIMEDPNQIVSMPLYLLRKYAKVTVIKRAFSDKKRQELADKGHALPDGSFPIENASDLHNAVQAIGRAKDPGKAKAHIKSRAKDLGMESAIPDTWKAADVEKHDHIQEPSQGGDNVTNGTLEVDDSGHVRESFDNPADDPTAVFPQDSSKIAPKVEDGSQARETSTGVIKFAPPGWEDTVTAMKDHPEIDNPHALAWWMDEGGFTSHKSAYTEKSVCLGLYSQFKQLTPREQVSYYLLSGMNIKF